MPSMTIREDILCLLLLIILCVQVIYAVNITIAVMVTDGKQPYHIQRSGPAIDIAITKVPGMLPADVNITYIRRTYPADSCKNHVGAITADIFYTNNISAFIGPGCSLAVDIVGRMASSWNIPIISPVATNGELGNKKDFTTLTRLAYNMNNWAKIYIALFQEYGWKDIAIIHDTDYVFFTIVGTSLEEALVNAGIRVYRQFYHSKQKFNMVKMLRKASERSRIFIIANYGNDLRKTMLLAQDLGMTNGEYVFIASRLFKGGNVGDDWWKRGDHLDAKAKRAYESLFVTQPRRPATREFLAFEEDIKVRAQRDYNYTYGDAEVSIFITAYHDALIVYAHALNETLFNGENYMDGKLMNTKLWGKNFPGISGTVAIDDQGDREMDFSLLDMDPDTGEDRVVANYFGSIKKVIFGHGNTSIHWPNNVGSPLNVPVCGFLGDEPACQTSEISSETVIAVALAGTFAVFVVITVFIYRRFKLESDLQSHWWKVKWRDLEFANRGSRAGSRLSSMHSSVRLGSRTDAIPVKNTATLKSVTVVVQTLQMEHIKTDRRVLMELKHMRDIHCTNLSRFYGLCVDAGHACVLWEHCSRGSLQDILHNDAIKLDNEFKLSLMNDIITGMCYIHSSNIVSHGRLRSANCLIDGRFVLKITDFSLSAIRVHETIPEDYNKYVLLYVAPEHLQHAPLQTSSPAGDVYSFAIVLYELLTRTEPYEVELDTHSITELLDMLKEGKKQVRPYVEQYDIDPGLRKLMEDCWSMTPEGRPTFQMIRKRSKEMFRSSANKNILDTLLQRMEQYADNLEGLVEERTQDLLDEKKKSEELLLEILPKTVADKLKYGQTVEPEAYESVTIYFSDIVGFTSISAVSAPMQVIDLLNDLYTCFDKIIENFDVYKVETIGDAYMVVSGLPVRNGNEHVRQIARMSLSILKSVRSFKIRHLPSKSLQARIGLHSGSVCAGVVGQKMPRYCLFGDTVNTASRMESNGEAMKIHISDSVHTLLLLFPNFLMEERGEINVKGKGTMQTYWLVNEEGDEDGAIPHGQKTISYM